MTDPIADMLVRIRNAQQVNAETVDIPHSKMKESIAKLLVSEGYLGRFEVLKRMAKSFIRASLKYDEKKKGLITDMKRVSKSGLRVYTNSSKLPKVQRGFGTAILSTSKGVMTDEMARQQKVGGEVLCYVW